MFNFDWPKNTQGYLSLRAMTYKQRAKVPISVILALAYGIHDLWQEFRLWLLKPRIGFLLPVTLLVWFAASYILGKYIF